MTYFVSTMNKDGSLPRCVGFFHCKYSAEDVILRNINDIHEQTYDYAIIEGMEHEGLYPWVDQEEWFEWKGDGYIQIDKPEEFKNIANFSIG